jgi:hypothetical protein
MLERLTQGVRTTTQELAIDVRDAKGAGFFGPASDEVSRAIRNASSATPAGSSRVYPNIDVWIRTNQAAFVQELRTIVGRVGGRSTLQYTTLLRKATRGRALCLAAMAVVVFLSSGPSLRRAARAGPAFSAVWLVGMMGFFDVPFNPQHHDPAPRRRHRRHYGVISSPVRRGTEPGGLAKHGQGVLVSG